MVHAPDTGRLRSLLARPFRLGLRTEAHRSRIAHDPFDRLEPLFDPVPLTGTRNPEPPYSTPASEPERTVGFASPSRAQHTPARRMRSRARYGLPGALPSEVFGPYAQSAEAELNADMDVDDELDTVTPTVPPDAEAPDNLVDRLSRALSGIDPGIEKNSVGHLPQAAADGQGSYREDHARLANGDTEVMKSNEPLADEI